MKKTKTEKGITLVALIITIIILLILAVVTINAVRGDGIIQYANDAAYKYNQAATNEQAILDSYLEKMGGGNNKPAKTLAEAITDDMFTKKVNSELTDIHGNKIVVPAGFKILVDDTTVYTQNNISVTKGVVIQDKEGNEFVWIPVGNDISDGTNTYEIILGRYQSFVKNDQGKYAVYQSAAGFLSDGLAIELNGFSEYTANNKPANITDRIAKDIVGFCEKSLANKGYYIGRYELGKTTDNKIVCKKNQTVTENITSFESWYSDKTTYTCDLVNSYAWDTAIIFIQTFGNCEDYYNQNFSSETLVNTGMNSNDKYCNIHDMSSNAIEKNTEIASDFFEASGSTGAAYSYRGGGVYNPDYTTGKGGKASNRLTPGGAVPYYYAGRPIIYF